MTKLTAPIVGMHFRPPAKDVINMLPTGADLELRRQSDNEYDANAVQVFLHGFSREPTSAHAALYETLAAGQEDLFLQEAGWVDPLPLGYICSKKSGMAKLFAQAMDEAGRASVCANLSFDMAGKPQVETEFEPWEQGELEVEEETCPECGEILDDCCCEEDEEDDARDRAMRTSHT